MTDFTDIDLRLTNPETFASEDFHDLFTTLRREDPVHLTQGTYSRPYWSVTTHEDNVRLLQDPITFSSQAGAHLPPHGRDLTDQEREKMGFDANLVVMDPPEHDALRQPFNKHFSVPAVANMRQTVEGIVDGIVKDLSERGSADLIADAAAVLPVSLFLNLMEVPREDWEYLTKIALEWGHPQDPTLTNAKDGNEVVINAMGKIYDYMLPHTLALRGKPVENFAGLIANMKKGDTPLSEREIGWMAFSMVAGGLETARNAVGVGMLELIRRPHFAAMLTDDKVAKSATEEVLRWSTPSKNRLRLATADTELGGKKIAKGDWLVGWIVSGNRDEAVFDQPQEFDILRTPNKHLGYGDGIHMCLGRNLARLEIQVLLQKLFAAFPDMELTGDADWIVSDNSTGLRKLPVVFEPRKLA